MHSAAVSLANDPLKLKAEVLQLRDVVEEKDRALSEKSQRIEQLLDYILLTIRMRLSPPCKEGERRKEKAGAACPAGRAQAH